MIVGIGAGAVRVGAGVVVWELVLSELELASALSGLELVLSEVDISGL